MQNSFANRHIGIRNDEVPSMLSEIGNKTIDELVSQTIPHSILKIDERKVDKAVNENDYLKHLGQRANKNTLNDNYIGGHTVIEGIDVQPLSGRTVYFDGMEFRHGVSNVIKRDRYTLSMWYGLDNTMPLNKDFLEI